MTTATTTNEPMDDIDLNDFKGSSTAHSLDQPNEESKLVTSITSELSGRNRIACPISTSETLLNDDSRVWEDSCKILEDDETNVKGENEIMNFSEDARSKRDSSRTTLDKDRPTTISDKIEHDSLDENVSDNTQYSDSRSGITSKTVKKGTIESGKDLFVHERALEDSANCWSSWMLNYLTPLLKLGSRKLLDQDDVGVPPERDRAERAYAHAMEAWKIQSQLCREKNAIRKRKYEEALSKCNSPEQRQKLKPPKEVEPSIASSLVKSFGVVEITLGIVYYIISAFLSFVPVLILSDLVRFFESGVPMSEWDGYAHPWVEVVALGVAPLLVSILQTRHQVIMAHCAVFVRTAVSTMLYRKALRVSAAGRAKTNTGQVVNMMSNDTAQLQRFLQFVGMTMVAPLQIILALILIYRQVGNATWVGVGYMIVLAPVNIVIFSIVSNQRRRVLKYSDARVKMMNEILTGIRIIKFYAWERPFWSEVGGLRSKELEALTKLSYTSAVGFSLILLATPIIQPILVFLTYVAIQDKPMDASTAFTTVALFNIMRFPFAFLPMGLLQYIQSLISLRRLERYLDLPELAEYVDPSPPPSPYNHSTEVDFGGITIRNGTFAWVDPNAKPIREIQENKKNDKLKAKREKRESRRQSKAEKGSSNGESEKQNDSIGNSSHSVASSVMSDSSRAPTITLQDINVHIPAGHLVAVVGPVGSGKSSFLSAMLGEMEPINDSKVYIPRPPSGGDKGNVNSDYISYCSQTPWVVNDTLRGNILFGREFDEERYNEILDICALRDDLSVLPAGDMTEIGERGINLSGGQKARVSLARALYSRETSIIFMDDPLSAVDAHVGEHIFSRAINGNLAKSMTRILVTHHVHLLSRCDCVIVLKHGQIKHHGTYNELLSQGVDFAGAIDISKVSKSKTVDQSEQNQTVNQDAVDPITNADVVINNSTISNTTKPSIPKEVSAKSIVTTKTIGSESDDRMESSTALKANDHSATGIKSSQEQLKKNGENLLSKEEREEGNVSSAAYFHYAKAGGYWLAAWTFIIQGLGRGAEIMSGFWLAIWADRSIAAVRGGQPHTAGETNFYVGIYGLFGMIGVIGLTLRSITIAWHRLGASTKLHNDLTSRILRAPVSFFDVTPIGRVLNRFSADMDKIDLELTQSLSQGISTIFNVLGAIAAIIVATKGTFLVPLVPLSYAYYKIQKWFRKTSTELQRITNIANSPIFADFSMTLSGTSTIRAYGKEHLFFSHCKSSFDTMNASYILVQLTNYWLGLRLDFLGGFISVFIAAVAVATLRINLIPAGWLGFALSCSIEITSYLKHGVRMIATIEAQMNSVERVLHYSNNVPMEPPDFTENDPNESSWPNHGAIELKNASMRYRDGPLVLKDLSLSIKPGEKIGVCGRTGSGKSSLMIALFRISELEQDGGAIYIDNLDISSIGTSALRSNLSIIPQDPIIFSNTVRYNLDPFSRASDKELWEVLEKVEMAEVVAALPNGLLQEVSEGGENFSQGQRQLLCIARSLLRKPKILIMDEATASIDNATDNSIQQMIRDNFQNATVLTIAHRLNTIMDSDRVLVLDDGHIAEFDSPENLLANENSLFRAMIDKSRTAKDMGRSVELTDQ